MSLESRARILCVDDDIDLLDTISEYMTETLKVSVATASSVSQALSLVRESKFGFDVIVSDFQLPPENGNGLHKSLRESGNESLFILYSGYSHVPVDEFKDDFFLGHLEKPDLRKLTKLVGSALASRTKK